MLEKAPLLDIKEFPVSLQLWFKSLRRQVAPTRIRLTAQAASITTLTLPMSDNRNTGYPDEEGMYLVSVYHVCSTAGAAGTLTTTIGWNDGVAARTATPAAAINLNATNYASGSVLVYSLSTTAITYASAIAGGAGSPKFALYIACTKVD